MIFLLFILKLLLLANCGTGKRACNRHWRHPSRPLRLDPGLGCRLLLDALYRLGPICRGGKFVHFSEDDGQNAVDGNDHVQQENVGQRGLILEEVKKIEDLG